ncbi:MAG: holo-ACP synthase [Thermotogae bacterium]|nr:holo-ACP synthase [Thermotogota bacterium]
MFVGTDLVAIERIQKALERFGTRFPERFLSVEERETLKNTVNSLAGYWAAKEAVAKALGSGIGSELGFYDICLTKTSKGIPTFTLSDKAQKRFPIRQSSLSISHDGGFAIAVVVIELRAES